MLLELRALTMAVLTGLRVGDVVRRQLIVLVLGLAGLVLFQPHVGEARDLGLVHLSSHLPGSLFSGIGVDVPGSGVDVPGVGLL